MHTAAQFTAALDKALKANDQKTYDTLLSQFTQWAADQRRFCDQHGTTTKA